MPDSKASTPIGVNHLVLNVRDMEASHRFYTEVLGYQQVGELGDVLPMTMRFYSTHGKHHDVALVEQDKPDPPDSDWSMGRSQRATDQPLRHRVSGSGFLPEPAASSAGVRR